MNYKLINKVRKHKFNNPSTKLVALTLACIANEKGDNLYTSLETMAEETGLGIATVRRSYRELENTNVIYKTKESKGFHVNKYAFTQAWVPQESKPDEPTQITPQRKLQLWSADNWKPAPYTNAAKQISKTPDDILAEMQEGPAKHTFRAMLANIRKKEQTQ